MNWFGADIYVDFAWGDPPLTADASCTWVDETAYVRSVSTRRGTTSELSPVAPGTMSVALDNSGRRFDPSNTAGAHYGELLPMTKVRFRAGAGATVVVFSGFVLGWPITYPGIVDSVVTVQCVDAMRVLEQSELPQSAYRQAVLADSPMNYWPMQEAAGSRSIADIVDPTGDMRKVEEEPADSSSAGYPVGDSQVMLGEYRNPYVTSLATPATLEMWVSVAPDNDLQLGEVIRAAAGDDFMSIKPATYTAVDGSRSAALEVRYSHGGKSDSATGGVTLSFPMPDGQVFHLAVVASSTTLTVYVNGQAVATDTLASSTYSYNVSRAAIYTNAAKAFSHVAAYTTALTATQIAAHYEAGISSWGHPRGDRTGTRIDRILTAIGWPSADRDIATGSTVCDQWVPNGAAALSQIRTLETTEQGLFFISADGKPTFRDRPWFRGATNAVTPRYIYGDGGGSEIPYEDIEIDGNHLEHIRNTVTVSYSDGTVVAKDSTSRTNYSIQSESVGASDLLTPDGWLARQLGNFRLRARKDPTTRIPMLRIQPRGAGVLSTTVPSVTALELGDRVRVIRRPNGSTDPIQQDCNVLGINHTVTAKGVWTTDLYLAPARQSYVDGNLRVTGDADYSLTGIAHLVLTGTTGDYATTPDSAALDISGDLELVTLMRAVDYTPSASNDVFGKRASGNNSFSLQLLTDGTLRLNHSTDGSTIISNTSTVSLTTIRDDGEWGWVKVTLDVDNGAGGHDVKFYTRAFFSIDEPPSWVQLGATVTTAGTTSIYSGTADLYIGARDATTNPFAGSIARAIIRDGIDGTVAFDFSASAFTTHGQSTVTEQSVNAATVTIAGDARAHPVNVTSY